MLPEAIDLGVRLIGAAIVLVCVLGIALGIAHEGWWKFGQEAGFVVLAVGGLVFLHWWANNPRRLKWTLLVAIPIALLIAVILEDHGIGLGHDGYGHPMR
jgi:hypothetical protein